MCKNENFEFFTCKYIDKQPKSAKIQSNVQRNCVVRFRRVFIFLEQESEIMKRIKAACICQTLHFMLKDGAEHQWAVNQVRLEVENYKKGLERSRTRYRIVEEAAQPDGSVILKIIKQYNASPVGDYLA